MNPLVRQVSNYRRELVTRFGEGWNRFWFKPADPLSLALLRILVGLIAFIWLAAYTFDLPWLFGTNGLLPAEAVRAARGARGFSFLDFADSSGILWAVHVGCLAVVAAFTAGWYSRCSSILTAIIVLSYIWRAPTLAGEFEDLLAMFVVYLCLGPTGACLSVDNWRQGRRLPAVPAMRRSSSWSTVALRMIQVHLALIYVCMVLAKLRDDAWWQGQAVWFLAANVDTTLLDMNWLKQYPLLIAAWTHAIIAYELLFPILIWNRLARPLLIALGACHWFGLALLTGLPGFCLLMFVGSLAYVPAAAWRRCRPHSEPSTTPAAIPEPASKKNRGGAARLVGGPAT